MNSPRTIKNSLESCKEVGLKGRTKRCEIDTSSDIAVPLKPGQMTFSWDAECRKPVKPLFSVVDEQSRIRVRICFSGRVGLLPVLVVLFSHSLISDISVFSSDFLLESTYKVVL